MRRVILRQLSSLGYRVLEAKQADAALRVMEKKSVDVLLTDIVMPGGKDGIELARQARQRWPMIAVIFSSGFSPARSGGIAVSLPPGTPLLSKPYRKENLAKAIREALLRVPAEAVSSGDNEYRPEPTVAPRMKIAPIHSAAAAGE